MAGRSVTSGDFAGAEARVATLAELTLRDHEDRPARLGDLWADSTAVLVWLRHYG